jgi:hypothetical protein
MIETEPSILERRLLKEIADIDARVAELQTTRRSLERLVVKVRREAPVEGGKVARKNSAGRILIEQAIVESLRAALKPMTNKAIFTAARAVDYDLKEVTLRSYLHRMKARGLIEHSGAQGGSWQLRRSHEKKQLR